MEVSGIDRQVGTLEHTAPIHMQTPIDQTRAIDLHFIKAARKQVNKSQAVHIDIDIGIKQNIWQHFDAPVFPGHHGCQAQFTGYLTMPKHLVRTIDVMRTQFEIDMRNAQGKQTTATYNIKIGFQRTLCLPLELHYPVVILSVKLDVFDVYVPGAFLFLRRSNRRRNFAPADGWKEIHDCAVILVRFQPGTLVIARIRNLHVVDPDPLEDQRQDINGGGNRLDPKLPLLGSGLAIARCVANMNTKRIPGPRAFPAYVKFFRLDLINQCLRDRQL